MSTPFSPEETERYARHLVLPEIGGPGQQKLKAARVLVVGAGGLGAPALQYLAAAGVGSITVIDDDRVSLSNLQRQIIHGSADIGHAKVESAANGITAINPHVETICHDERLDPDNALERVSGHTVALDGSDNFQTRYLLADICAQAQVPLVTAAVNRFDGSITTLKPWIDDNPGYRDLFPNQPEDGLLPSCSKAGVLGVMTGLMGTFQALEAIKLITGAGDCLIGKLMMVDALSMRVETIRYKRLKR